MAVTPGWSWERWRDAAETTPDVVVETDRDGRVVWLQPTVPAGICVLEDSRRSLGEGYVGILGVLEQFRGRGLAQLLLQHAFVRDRDRGLTGTRLGVDAENTTGAVGLYEKVGMHAARTREGRARTL